MDRQEKRRILNDIATVAGSCEVVRLKILDGNMNMKLFNIFEHLFIYMIDCMKAGADSDNTILRSMKLLAIHADEMCNIADLLDELTNERLERVMNCSA